MEEPMKSVTIAPSWVTENEIQLWEMVMQTEIEVQSWYTISIVASTESIVSLQ